jgi:hypothetical protein
MLMSRFYSTFAETDKVNRQGKLKAEFHDFFVDEIGTSVVFKPTYKLHCRVSFQERRATAKTL